MFSDFGIPNPFRSNPSGDNKENERQKLQSKLQKVDASIANIEKSILKPGQESSKKFSFREFSSNLPVIKQFLEKRLVTLKGQQTELKQKLETLPAKVQEVQERYLPIEGHTVESPVSPRSQDAFKANLKKAFEANDEATLKSLAARATLSILRELPLTLIQSVLKHAPDEKVAEWAATPEQLAKDDETIKTRGIELENRVLDELPENADDKTVKAKIDEAKNSDQLLKNFRSQFTIRAQASFYLLAKRVNNNPALSERIVIRNQIEALEKALTNDPELKRVVTALRKQENETIASAIVTKFETVKTKEDVANLTAPERQEMLKNPKCTDDSIKKMIESSQKEVAAKNLVKQLKNGFSLVSSGNTFVMALSEILIVRSTSVIPADFLFHAALAELRNNPTDKQQERIINFCISWAAANRGTSEFAKAQEPLEAIAKLETLSQDRRDVLAKIIKLRAIPIPTPAFSSEAKPPVSLKTILENIGTQDLASAESQKAVALLANDLLTINRSLYQRLDRTDLAVSKWPNGKSPSTQDITNFFNQLTSFITSNIVGEADVAKQKQAIKFFITLAEACRQRSDIASLKGILGAINSAFITNLKTSEGTSVLAEVIGTDSKPTEYGTLLNEANRLTSDLINSKVLREFYDSRQNKDVLVTPYIGTFLQDNTFLEEQPKIVSTDSEETANLAKLSKLIEVEDKFLKFQQAAGADDGVVVTDIYSQVTDLQVPEEFLALRQYDLEAKRSKENLSRLEERQLATIMKGSYTGNPPSEKISNAVKAALTLQKHIAFMNASSEFSSLQSKLKPYAENEKYPTIQKVMKDLANANNPGGAVSYFKSAMAELANFSNVPELKTLTEILEQSAFAKYVKAENDAAKIKASIETEQ
ncbi:MAG: RasGEF domain-containing protein [Chlamydiales bacterium]|nr:RasGEF domain-containing protein [Chlamydiales bacterium]